MSGADRTSEKEGGCYEKGNFGFAYAIGLSAAASFIGTSAFGQTVFMDDFACGVGVAGLCDASQPGFRTHALETPSGNVVLNCNCFPTGGKPESTMVFENLLCGTGFGLTTDSHLVWAKGGRASLTCIIHP